jgi:hypothetical protein
MDFEYLAISALVVILVPLILWERWNYWLVIAPEQLRDLDLQDDSDRWESGF